MKKYLDDPKTYFVGAMIFLGLAFILAGVLLLGA